MESLPTLYAAAVLLPLASFVIILLFARTLDKFAAVIATSAILGAGFFSFLALGIWLTYHFPPPVHHGEHAAAHDGHGGADTQHGGHEEPGAKGQEPGAGSKVPHAKQKTSRRAAALSFEYVSLVQEPAGEGQAHAPAQEESTAEQHGEAHPVYAGEYYTLGEFGPLRVTISYYIDALTVVMFCMVTFIATCIHFYAIGYMHDELTDVTDKEVVTSSGQVLHRPGRFPRFFQYLSLFCFSMLGLVLSGNIAMVFVFWELVGICSYFLIGFYVERKSASDAGNKAFIVNRVGDFGMIIGLMVLWSTLGTFSFGDVTRSDDEGHQLTEPGIFSLVRPGPEHALTVPDGMVQADAKEQIGERNGKPVMGSAVAEIVRDHASSRDSLAGARSEMASRTPAWRQQGYGYWLLV